ncbi:MAG: hypothetical protein U0074_05390 [Kouleothrix sp.]
MDSTRYYLGFNLVNGIRPAASIGWSNIVARLRLPGAPRGDMLASGWMRAVCRR